MRTVRIHVVMAVYDRFLREMCDKRVGIWCAVLEMRECQIEQICRQRYCGLAEPAVSRFLLSFPSVPPRYLRYEMLTAVVPVVAS